mgnify:FL=1
MFLGKAKLSVKLIAGFTLVALLCLVVGILALTTESRLQRAIINIGNTQLPGVEYVLTINEAFSTIKAGERSLANYSITADIKEQELNRIKEAIKTIEKVSSEYEKIEKTKEAEEI